MEIVPVFGLGLLDVSSLLAPRLITSHARAPASIFPALVMFGHVLLRQFDITQAQHCVTLSRAVTIVRCFSLTASNILQKSVFLLQYFGKGCVIFCSLMRLFDAYMMHQRICRAVIQMCHSSVASMLQDLYNKGGDTSMDSPLKRR